MILFSAWASLDKLGDLSATCTKKAIDEFGFSLGVTFHPEGFLWDLSVRNIFGPSHVLGDALHCYLSNGNAEARLFLEKLSGFGLTCESFRDATPALNLDNGLRRSVGWRRDLFKDSKFIEKCSRVLRGNVRLCFHYLSFFFCIVSFWI